MFSKRRKNGGSRRGPEGVQKGVQMGVQMGVQKGIQKGVQKGVRKECRWGPNRGSSRGSRLGRGGGGPRFVPTQSFRPNSRSFRPNLESFRPNSKLFRPDQKLVRPKFFRTIDRFLFDFVYMRVQQSNGSLSAQMLNQRLKCLLILYR